MGDRNQPESAVTALDADFWILFRLCQLRILISLIGYALDVNDASLLQRACDRLSRVLDNV
jgi:hypothetical protein